MSKLGQELIDLVKEANEKGWVTLQTSPDVTITNCLNRFLNSHEVEY